MRPSPAHNRVNKEFELKSTPDNYATFSTMAEQRVTTGGRTNFVPQSLDSDEHCIINDTLIVPQFLNHVDNSPQAMDVSELLKECVYFDCSEAETRLS